MLRRTSRSRRPSPSAPPACLRGAGGGLRRLRHRLGRGSRRRRQVPPPRQRRRLLRHPRPHGRGAHRPVGGRVHLERPGGGAARRPGRSRPSRPRPSPMPSSASSPARTLAAASSSRTPAPSPPVPAVAPRVASTRGWVETRGGRAREPEGLAGGCPGQTGGTVRLPAARVADLVPRVHRCATLRSHERLAACRAPVRAQRGRPDRAGGSPATAATTHRSRHRAPRCRPRRPSRPTRRTEHRSCRRPPTGWRSPRWCWGSSGCTGSARSWRSCSATSPRARSTVRPAVRPAGAWPSPASSSVGSAWRDGHRRSSCSRSPSANSVDDLDEINTDPSDGFCNEERFLQDPDC